MTGRKVAELLGVSGRMPRVYAERGVLKAVKLPGCGYHRDLAADVEALAVSMGIETQDN